MKENISTKILFNLRILIKWKFKSFPTLDLGQNDNHIFRQCLYAFSPVTLRAPSVPCKRWKKFCKTRENERSPEGAHHAFLKIGTTFFLNKNVCTVNVIILTIRKASFICTKGSVIVFIEKGKEKRKHTGRKWTRNFYSKIKET